MTMQYNLFSGCIVLSVSEDFIRLFFLSALDFSCSRMRRFHRRLIKTIIILNRESSPSNSITVAVTIQTPSERRQRLYISPNYLILHDRARFFPCTDRVLS